MSSPDPRHARQVILPEVDVAGQRALAGAEVRVEGCGLAARTCALYLTGAGVGILEVDAGLVAPCRRLDPDVDVAPAPPSAEHPTGLRVRVGTAVYEPDGRDGPVDAGARAARWALRQVLP